MKPILVLGDVSLLTAGGKSIERVPPKVEPPPPSLSAEQIEAVRRIPPPKHPAERTRRGRRHRRL